MSLQPRPQIANLKTCPHGGIDYAELKALGMAPEAVIDFSVSSNPFMPPLSIGKALSRVAIDKYPDSAATEFIYRLSQRLGTPPENILAGSGSTELIQLISLTYFRPGDPVLILEPTYGEYAGACRLVGAEPIRHWTGAEDNFMLQVSGVIASIQRVRPRGVFICNPNNPTGHYFSREDIAAILEAVGEGLLILDEAYVAFVAANWSSLDLINRGNVIILRSMTKDYGLAGLRLGYAVTGGEISRNLRRARLPWNVNAIAQKAGVMVLDKADYLEQSLEKVREAGEFLVDGLSALGLHLLPSSAHFFLVKVGDAPAFRAALLGYGIMVRDCTSFGLPEYVRIAPRTMTECQQLIAAIKAMKDKGETDVFSQHR
ncbi:pyridoxal phosphate-dependent aminotransferase [Chloroflexota bacterium]